MENKKQDVGADIMEERLTWAVTIVKKKCNENSIEFTEAMMIKALEVGISLYIQKEKRQSMSH